MKSTEKGDVTTPLSERQVTNQLRNAKVILRGFSRLATIRLRQFREQNKISADRYFELTRFFDDIRMQILSKKLETSIDVKVQNEHLGDYAYVAASFVPDADMWVALLNEKPVSVV